MGGNKTAIKATAAVSANKSHRLELREITGSSQLVSFPFRERLTVPFRAPGVYRASVEGETSWLRRRQRRSDTLGEVRRVAGGLGQAIDPCTPPQLFERQGGIQQASPIQASIGIPIKPKTNVKVGELSGDPRITHDVDGATVAEEMVELRPACKFVDPVKVDEKEPARIFGQCFNVVKIDVLVTVIRAYPHDVSLISHDVDQAELLEE
jgi:hypothetical protein